MGLLITGNIGMGIVKGSMENILHNLPGLSKFLLSIIMIAGRLELWTIFTLLYLRETGLMMFREARGKA
jgi:Trk-type K+ transport system membrane component